MIIRTLEENTQEVTSENLEANIPLDKLEQSLDSMNDKEKNNYHLLCFRE